MSANDQPTARRTFRHVFLRGLAILLPTILTIWILIAAYGFVRDNIAEPINLGIREAVVRWSSYPYVGEPEQLRSRVVELRGEERTALELSGESDRWLLLHFKRIKLKQQWDLIWFPMNVIGLILAIVVIYFVGRFVGSYIGSRLHRKGELLLTQVPVIKQVYPHVKQVTDFVFGSGHDRLKFKRVVAVQYPRKGLWSLGLVTGDPMRTIQSKESARLLTVFVPSSPTPFTGYVVTVRADETIDMPLSIEEALKFTVSGGVLTPPAEIGAAGQDWTPRRPEKVVG